MSASSLESKLNSLKLRRNKKNLTGILIREVKELKWDVNYILATAFDLELQYVIKYYNRFEWTANEFVGNSTQEEICDFSDSVRSVIRNDRKDASVLFKKVNDLFWISIIIKNLKKIGIYEKPCYLALSSNGRYFFTKDVKSNTISKYLTSTLGYKKSKKLKLSGRSVPSLLELLIRREKGDVSNRPVFNGGKFVENELGYDFTQRKNYYDYFDECVDGTDINLQKYTVTSVGTPWLGDDNPVLTKMEFKSSLTFKGDVARIIRELPVASVVQPPLPAYLLNFSIKGRNVVSL